MRKNSVFWAFCATFPKKCEKTVFFNVFRDTLYKVCKKCKKRRFLSFLRDVPQKVWGNSVFSRYLRHLNLLKVSQKLRKTAFFELSARCSSKSVWKQCFFTFFETLFTKFSKNAEKQRFLSFLRDISQVARKYCANIGSIIIYWLIIGILDSNIRLISNQYQDKIYFFIISTWYWVNI